jgi:hypothetical protein
MDTVDLDGLRDGYRKTASPAAVLKQIARSAAHQPCHKLELIARMRSAFGLSLQQASPIAGWSPDGTGELKDAQIDTFLTPAIESTRGVWDHRPGEDRAQVR